MDFCKVLGMRLELMFKFVGDTLEGLFYKFHWGWCWLVNSRGAWVLVCAYEGGSEEVQSWFSISSRFEGCV